MNEKPSIDRRTILQGIGVSIGGSAFTGQAVKAGAPESVTPNEANTIAFSNLSTEGKELFSTALFRGSATRRKGFPAGLERNRFVRHNGRTYDLNKSFRYDRRNSIRPEVIKESDIPENTSVLAYEGLVERGRNWVDKAVSNGAHEVDATDGWVFDFGDRFLKRGETHYQLNFVHYDIPQYSIAPQEHEK